MIYGNLPPSTQGDATTEFFENFFKEPQGTSPNTNDAVIGYFQTLTGNADTGKALAATVLFTALSQDIDPMSMLDEFRKMPPNEVNAYLTYFLNSNRVPTSLLGLTNSPQTNKFIARAILP